MSPTPSSRPSTAPARSLIAAGPASSPRTSTGPAGSAAKTERTRAGTGEAGMWRNYMTVGVRALVKNKTYAFINIFGLGVGLAACLMLLIYVRYETSYDEWLPNSANTYQFQSHYQSKQTGEEM